VRRVVVHDEVDVEILRDFPGELVEKPSELDRPMVAVTLADHLTVAMSSAAKSVVVPWRKYWGVTR
jgi:hypothetical protein